MDLKLLSKKNIVKATAALGVSLLSFSASAQTTVNIQADAELVGYANWFELDGTTYVDGIVWGIPDMKTTVNTTENTITLQPNFSAYGDGTDPYWANGATGAKVFEGNTYIQNDALIGQTVTFEGSTVSNTLAAGYTGIAFIKILNADYQLVQYLTADLVTGQNFSLVSQTATVGGAAHFQYGYSVTGVNANPNQESALGMAVVSPETNGVNPDPTGTVIMLDTNYTGELLAYANWYNLDETYEDGSPWTLPDLMTVVDTDNNNFILYPNFNTYGDGTNDYWANGEIGNKIFEGNTYIEDNSLLGDEVTFVGHVVSNTLADGYTAVAFIKVMNVDYALLNYTSADLVGGEDFSVYVNVADYPAGAHVQYGYAVTGLNANPTQMEALGNAVVTSVTAGVEDFKTAKTVIYPNPATTVLNIATEGNLENVTIYNYMGQKVAQSANATVDVSTLTSGMYIVVTKIDGAESTSRFVKQ